MIKRILLAFVFFLTPLAAFGQSTLVSATVTDSGGQNWNAGYYTFTFYPAPTNPGGPYFWTGGAFNPSMQISGGLSATGQFTNVSVPSNSAITPSGSQWTVTVCPAATATCYSKTMTITGSSQNISANLTPPALVVKANNTSQISAYQDSEISGALLGTTYYNLTDNTMHLCNSTLLPCTWTSLGSSGGSAPGGNNNDVQCKNGSIFGSCGPGSGFAANVGVAGNIAVKPGTGGPVIYVCPVVLCALASDSNDGTSWGTAKLTVYGAWNALPTAGCNFGPGCGGTIYVADNTTWGGPVSGQGLRILGASDPNFSSPPSGWVKEKSVVIACGGIGSWDSTQATGSCLISGNSSSQPALWISGSNVPMEFDGLKMNVGSGSVIALDSNSVFENNAGTSNKTFRNCSFGETNSPTTNGPGLRIGPNSFEQYFYSSVFDGNPTATGGTEARQGLVLDPGSTSNNDSGNVYVRDSHVNSGGMEVVPDGAGSAGAVVNGLLCEGQTDSHGCVWITQTSSTTLFSLANVWTADSSPSNVAVEVDGNGPPDAVTVITQFGGLGTYGTVQGPATLVGSAYSQSSVVSPDRQHQVGFSNGHVLGQTDAARRGFPPTAVRFASIANTLPTAWTTAGGGVITTGITAPDGTTGAGTCSSSSGTADCYFYNANQTFALGDIVVIGTWARARNSTGFVSGDALGFSTPFCSVGTCNFTDISGNGSASNSFFTPQYILGDGSSGSPPAEWEWYWKVLKVTGTSGSATTIQFIGLSDPTHPADYYAPMFLHIPVNAISDNEAAELGLNLQPYSNTCTVGQLCMVSGPVILGYGAIVPTCTAAGLNAAAAALPSGGIVDARICTPTLTLNNTVTFGAPNVPIELLLPSGTVNFTNTSGNGFVINGSGSKLIGQGSIGTIVTAGAGFTGDYVHVEPQVSVTSLNAIQVSGFRVDGTNCPSCKQLNLLSVRDPSLFFDLDLRFWTGNAVNINISGNSGALIPEGIGMSNMYLQSGAGALTADSFVVTGNQIEIGNNVKIISVSATPGAFRGLVIKPSGTANGDGRANHFFASSIYGYSSTGPCLSIEAPAGAPAGAIGNVIGPGNTFETCGLAWQLTGADASHLASKNYIFGNFYDSSVTDIGKLDFATLNRVIEVTNGVAGTITLTANSISNDIWTRLGGSTDISDSGSANDLFTSIYNGGANTMTLKGGLVASNVTDSALTSGNCVQAGSGGILGTVSGPCSTGGTVNNPNGSFKQGAALEAVNNGTGAGYVPGVTYIDTLTAHNEHNSTNASVSSAGSTVTCASCAFASSVAGQSVTIGLNGVGPGAGGTVMVTTIASYISGTSVTVTATAGTTNLTGNNISWGTPDATAINSAISTLSAAGGGEIDIPCGAYYTDATIQTYPNVNLKALAPVGQTSSGQDCATFFPAGNVTTVVQIGTGATQLFESPRISNLALTDLFSTATQGYYVNGSSNGIFDATQARGFNATGAAAYRYTWSGTPTQSSTWAMNNTHCTNSNICVDASLAGGIDGPQINGGEFIVTNTNTNNATAPIGIIGSAVRMGTGVHVIVGANAGGTYGTGIQIVNAGSGAFVQAKIEGQTPSHGIGVDFAASETRGNGFYSCISLATCTQFESASANNIIYLSDQGANNTQLVNDLNGTGSSNKVYTQNFTTGPHTTFSGLPSGSTTPYYSIILVTDCSTSACTAGGGTFAELLENQAGTWTPISGSGGGGGGTPASPNFSFQYDNGGAFGGTTVPSTNGLFYPVYNVTSSVAVAPQIFQVGMGGRAIGGSSSADTIGPGDVGSVINQDVGASGTVTETLPTATTLLNPAMAFVESNHSAQTLTLSPSSWTVQAGTFAPAATLAFPPGSWARMKVDPNSSTDWIADIVYQLPISAAVIGSNSSAQPVAATAANVYSLWSGTCSNTTFLRGDGSCQAPAGSGTVTTTGSPASGNLSKFSGATSITNGDLSGDCTTSGTLAITCTKINGNPFTATAHGISVILACADSSGSGTAQSCTTSPSFTPASGDGIFYTTTTANTGDVTTNVDSLGAVHIRKWLGAAVLASGDLPANTPVLLVYDGTYWEISTIGNAPAATAPTLEWNGSTGTAIFNLAATTSNILPVTGSPAVTASSANEIRFQSPAGRNLTITGMIINQSVVQPTSAVTTWTVRVCTPSSGVCVGSATAVTCTIVATQYGCSITGQSVNVTAGQLIDLWAVENGTGTNASNWGWAITYQ